MRKIMIALIALIAVFTFIAIGLNDNQPSFLATLFTQMNTAT